jgi:hypothetical protein
MRTSIILFATFLTATAASAAPRSLSTGEPATVELPPQRVQVLEAPQVQLAPPTPTAQAETTRTTPAPAPQASETTPAPAPAPVVTAPPVETKPAVAAPAAPAQPSPAVAARPEAPAKQKQATVQRKQRQRQAVIEHHSPRELRGIERTIGISVGAAISYAIANGAPDYW